MRYFPVALIVLAALTLALTWAALGPQQPLTGEELGSLTGTNWYSVQILGKRSGYACIEAEMVDGPGAPQLRVTEDVKILLTVAGRSLEAGKSQVTLYDQRLRPVSIEMVKNELGREQRIIATLEGNALTISKSGPEGDEGTRTLQVDDDFCSDVVIAWMAARGELHEGEELDFQSYDPEIDVLDRYHVAVEGREAVGDIEAQIVRTRSQQLGVEAVSWIDGSGTLLRQHVPGLMDLKLEMVPEQEALAELSPFEVASDIQVEGALPPRNQIDTLRLRITRRAGPADELIPATPRQQVTAEGNDALVAVSQERPPLNVVTLPVTDPELSEFLAPTYHAQSDDPRIVQKAREVVGDQTDAWAVAQKLLSWVYHNMRKVDSEPRPITAIECLQEMTGDCTEHAVLMAALGRAVGLPTRMCTGLVYVGGAFGYHAWTEVYIGRWVEMDPSWGQMTVDAGHLLLHSSSLDEVSYARASLATGRTLGSISIKLVSYRGTDGREVDLTEG